MGCFAYSRLGKNFRLSIASSVDSNQSNPSVSISSFWVSISFLKVHVGSMWGRRRLDVGSMWGRCRVNVGSMWGRWGVDVGSMWGRCGVDVESMWGWCGVDVRSMWGRCGVDVRSIIIYEGERLVTPPHFFSCLLWGFNYSLRYRAM